MDFDRRHLAFNSLWVGFSSFLQNEGHVRDAVCLNQDLLDCESGFWGLPVLVFDGTGAGCWTLAGSRLIVGTVRGIGGESGRMGTWWVGGTWSGDQ